LFPRGRGFCVAWPAISAPQLLVNKFTVLTIEDPNTIDSELVDAPPPISLVSALLMGIKRFDHRTKVKARSER